MSQNNGFIYGWVSMVITIRNNNKTDVFYVLMRISGGANMYPKYLNYIHDPKFPFI